MIMMPSTSSAAAFVIIACSSLAASALCVSAFSQPGLLSLASGNRCTRRVARFHFQLFCKANSDNTHEATNNYVTDERSNIQSRRSFGEKILTSFTASITATSFTTPATNAISPQEASRDYDVYAKNYDDLDGGSLASSLGIDEARKKLLSTARGDVLEVGVGTGLNLGSYQFCNNANNPDESGCVTSITLVDISENMLLQAQSRIKSLNIPDNIPIKFVKADATSELTQLFGENKFDTVVDTFSLCVMGNEGAKNCLSQLTSIVKPAQTGGRILLIENTRASNPLLGYYQDLTANAAADVGGKGCLYNQNVGEMIKKTDGLTLVKEEEFAAGFFRSFVCEK